MTLPDFDSILFLCINLVAPHYWQPLMTKNGKRIILGKGKGYISSTGPQYRFIVFLIFILVAFTLLLRVFQKLAEILQLPLFLPISLVTLMLFIGIVGTLYSHKFVGPLERIKRALDQMAEGEEATCLRLRETGDPMLKNIVVSIGRLCERTRNEHVLIQDQTRDLFNAVQELRLEAQKSGACGEQLEKHLAVLLEKQAHLEKTIKSFHRG